MRKKNLVKWALMTLLFVAGDSIPNHAFADLGDDRMGWNEESCIAFIPSETYRPPNSYAESYNSQYRENMPYYTTPDYQTGSGSYDFDRFGYSYYGAGYRGFNSDAQLHLRYDNSDNFSSGISSYQGTSTGPGPNGGYPGTPRGVYKTNYFNPAYQR